MEVLAPSFGSRSREAQSGKTLGFISALSLLRSLKLLLQAELATWMVPAVREQSCSLLGLMLVPISSILGFLRRPAITLLLQEPQPEL